ncbi:zinc ribbon domain-containing protein [Streptomyces sp. HSW2009]|uniref:zinc ribbon domain-containing protein n=1 Tax=Streptomyces sp. HSW2009 TaxID=3142890 RepID=UPI0032ED9C3A
MSQKPRLSACPSCAEPLDSEDNFCGACGTSVTATGVAPGPGVPAARPPPGGRGGPRPPAYR